MRRYKNCCERYETFLIKKYSDSDEDEIGSFTPSIPPGSPTNGLFSSLRPIKDILIDTAFPDLEMPIECIEQCKGRSDAACAKAIPQCIAPDEDDNDEIAAEIAVNIFSDLVVKKPSPKPFKIRERPPIPPSTTPPIIAEVINVYWLVTNNQARYPVEKQLTYDIVVRTVATSPTPTSFDLVQDARGQWGTPLNTFETLFVETFPQRVRIFDNHEARSSDDNATMLITWTKGSAIVRYFVTRVYEFVIPRLFDTITLPSDCMFWRDIRSHPISDTIGIGHTNNGASEAFWDKNQVNDKTITLDQRQIAEWSPPGHRHLEIYAPIWGNSTHNNFPMEVTLRNALDKPNIVTFYSSQQENLNVEETKTITRNVYLDGGINECKRFRYEIKPFIDSTATGFTAFSNFVTQVPKGIQRRQYAIRTLVKSAWRVVNGIATPILIKDTFNASNLAWASSPFGNRAGYFARNDIIEVQVWLFNWNQLFHNPVTNSGNEPPINLQFSGNIHIATTLTSAVAQTGVTYANPYDEDPAKIGIMTIGNGFLGAPALRQGAGTFTFYLSRQFNVGASLRVANLITLN